MGSTYSGLSGKSKKDFGCGDAKYITYMNVYSNPLATLAELDNISIDERQNKVLSGDVLFTTSSETPEEVGMSSVWRFNESNIYLNSFCFGYRPIEKFDPNFLAYMLRSNSVRNRIILLAQGISRYNISKKAMMEIEILFPSIKEQTAIGNFFKQLDDTIALHRRNCIKFQNLKTAYLENIFSAKYIQNKDKNKNAWEQRKLGDIATFSKGFGFSKSDLTEFGIPIILYGRLYTNYQTSIEQVDTFVKFDKKSIKSTGNEVIVPSSGETQEDIARASAVTTQGIILAGDLNIIKPNEIITPVFLALSLSNGHIKRELSKRAQGKSVVHLRNDDLKEINLTYPETREQTAIGNFFKQLDDTIALHQRFWVNNNQLGREYAELF